MSKIHSTVGSQPLQVAEFYFSAGDLMRDVTRQEVDFGKTNTAATSWEVIRLPNGAVVQGGELVTLEAWTGGFTVKVGDDAAEDRYFEEADIKTAGRRPLKFDGEAVEGASILFSATAQPSATGRGVLRVQYVIPFRQTEVTG